MMKRILLLLTLIMLQLQAFSFEDYIIVSENPVNTVFSDDENIALILPLYNIDNSKNILFLKAKGTGKTIVTIETTEGEAYLDVEVTEDKTVIPQLDNLKYFSLDIPKIKSSANEEEKSSELTEDESSLQDDYVPEKPVLREGF